MSDSPPNPLNNFPATDSSCLVVVCGCGFEVSINPPNPPKSFPVTDSDCEEVVEGLTVSVRPPRLIPPNPPKKLDSCLGFDGDCCGLDLGMIGFPVLGSILGDPDIEEPGDSGPGEVGPGDFCLGVVGGVKPWSLWWLCCFMRRFPGFPGACFCGDGGTEPCLGFGGSMPPIARCIWQFKHSHSLPAESGGLKPHRLHTWLLHSVQLL